MWASGWFRCEHCEHECACVYPADALYLECEKCGAYTAQNAPGESDARVLFNWVLVKTWSQTRPKTQ